MGFKSYFKRLAVQLLGQTQGDVNKKVDKLKEQVEAKIKLARAEMDRKLGNESARPNDKV